MIESLRMLRGYWAMFICFSVATIASEEAVCILKMDLKDNALEADTSTVTAGLQISENASANLKKAEYVVVFSTIHTKNKPMKKPLTVFEWSTKTGTRFHLAFVGVPPLEISAFSVMDKIYVSWSSLGHVILLDASESNDLMTTVLRTLREWKPMTDSEAEAFVVARSAIKNRNSEEYVTWFSDLFTRGINPARWGILRKPMIISIARLVEVDAFDGMNPVDITFEIVSIERNSELFVVTCRVPSLKQQVVVRGRGDNWTLVGP